MSTKLKSLSLVAAVSFGLLGFATQSSAFNERAEANKSESYKAERRTFLSDFKIQNKKVKVAFLDADSTLRVSRSGSVSANTPTDVAILPNVATALATLNEQGYLLMIVSNQGGIAAGMITEEIADRALKFTVDQIKQKVPAATIHYYDFAEAKNEFRKPETGMAQELERRLQKEFGASVDYSQSIMIGDSAYKKDVDTHPDGSPGTHFSNADRLFAKNLGIKFIEPTDFFGWRAHGINVFENLQQVDAYCAVQECLK